METKAKKDIYDEEGRLLLSKGQRITDKVIAKLKKFGLSEPEEITDVNEEQHPVLDPIAQAFQERKGIRNQHVLERPQQVLWCFFFVCLCVGWWFVVFGLCFFVFWFFCVWFVVVF
ncbi:MAG: phosphohydrolase, partial [Bacillota bacterium]|nr:phosphohydrolase [Bacillota bacterium]